MPRPFLVRDIHVGSDGSHPNLFVDLEGTLVFVADDGVNGMELRASDDTTAGTVMIMDIDPGPGSSRPRELVWVGNEVYFNAAILASRSSCGRPTGRAKAPFWSGTATGKLLGSGRVS